MYAPLTLIFPILISLLLDDFSNVVAINYFLFTYFNFQGVQEADRSSEGFYIRSGITIILKNSTIGDGLVI
jgi:hypothetical protein